MIDLKEQHLSFLSGSNLLIDYVILLRSRHFFLKILIPTSSSKKLIQNLFFRRKLIPILKNIIDVPIDIKGIFVQSHEPLFHRQKVLNEMIMETQTKIVVNYDCDVILPIQSYVKAL